MNLLLPPFVVFLSAPTAAANSSRRHRRTLSASAKKPAALAGFLYLILSIAHHNGSFPSRNPLSRSPRSLHLLIQTPSS
jgi:hypothetical protein